MAEGEGPGRRILRQATWLGVPILAWLVVVGLMAGPMRPAVIAAHWAAVAPLFAVFDLAAVVGIVLAGTAVWLSGRLAAGALAMLAGLAWSGPDWASDPRLPTLLRAACLLGAVLVLPILIHLLLVVTGRPPRRRTALLVAGLYGTLAMLGAAWLVVYVPIEDPRRCLELCDVASVTALGDHLAARSLADAWVCVTIAAALGLTAWAGATILRRSRLVAGRAGLPAAGVMVGLAWAAWGLASLQPSASVPPTGSIAAGVFVGRALALVAVAIALGAWLAGFRRTVAAVRGISLQLAPFPGGGSLERQIGTAVGDPGLRLRYPDPGSAVLLDPDGRPTPRPDAGVTVHPVEHDGEVVALLVPARPIADAAIREGLGPAARLAIANERLLVAARHELLELRASRQRIVEAADAERHRLERDLHDGAQQSLTALLFDLVRARDAALATAAPATGVHLHRAVVGIEAAIDALRTISRGVHDPVLAESGLLAALRALAVDAPLPLELDLPEALPCRAETAVTAWRTVVETVERAARLGAAAIDGRVRLDAGSMRVALAVDGLAGAFDLQSVEDRVEATGGRLRSRWRTPATLELDAELPCG